MVEVDTEDSESAGTDSSDSSNAGVVRRVVRPQAVPKYAFPVDIPEWDETNSFVEPTSDFLQAPTEAEQAAMLKGCRDRLSAKSMKLMVCVVCSRKSTGYETVTVDQQTFLDIYGTSLKPASGSSLEPRVLPSPLPVRVSAPYAGMLVDWEGDRNFLFGVREGLHQN
jgi:hypothetical protein